MFRDERFDGQFRQHCRRHVDGKPQVETSLGESCPMAQCGEQCVLDQFCQRIVIEQAEIVLRPQEAGLRMMHAHERFGASETFASEIDLRLVPDVKPVVVQGLVDRNLRQCRFVRTGNSLGLIARSWVIRLLTEA